MFEKHDAGETSDDINYVLSFVKVGQFIKDFSLKISLIRFLFRIHFVFNAVYLQNNWDSIIIKVFYLPTDAQENCFIKNIKIYINTDYTCFIAITIIRECII